MGKSLVLELIAHGVARDEAGAQALVDATRAEFMKKMRETGGEFDVADLHDFCTERWGFDPDECEEEVLQ